MITLSATLAVLVVVLWPGRRPEARAHRGAPGQPGMDRDGLRSRWRRWWSTELRLPRSGPSWVAEFAELSAVGLDAGLPSGEAARLACAVGSAGFPQMHTLGELLAVTESEGGRLGDALAQASRRDRDLAFLAAAWRLSEELGAAAAPAARLTAEVLGERAASSQRRAVLAAGPRASMWLLTLLPLAGPGVVVVLGLPVSEVYGTGGAGAAGLLGLGLTASGWLWSRRLLSRALRPAVVT